MDAFTHDFMTQYEKSKREAMKKARPVGGLLVEGIYEEMNLRQGFDTTNQEQTQQQQEEPELTQEELAAFPFVIETDWAAEFGDEIAATEADESCKHNEESTLQNQSCLLDQSKTPVVNKVEFADSVTVVDNAPSKLSSEPEIMLKPKETNVVLSPLPPFIMETDESTEFGDEIAATEADDSSKHNEESTLQNESGVIDQATVVNEVEFSDSVNVTDNSPSKPPEPKIILKPKENNAVLSPLAPFKLVPLTINPNIGRLQSTTLSEQQQLTAVITSTSTSTSTSSQIVKPKMTRIDIRNNCGTITIRNNNNNNSNQTKSNMIMASKNNYRRSLRSNQTDKTYNLRIKKNSINTAVKTNNNVNKSVINKKKVIHDKVNKTNKKTNNKANNKTNKKSNNRTISKTISKTNNKPNKSRIIKKKNNTKSNVINKSGGTINRNSNNINNASNNSIICIANIDAEMDCARNECLLKEASNKVAVSKDSFGEGSKANNVEMVDTQQNQSAVETRPYLCATCNFRFTSYRDLQIHSAVHKNKVVLKCRFCEREFGCDTSRMNHEQIEHEKIQHYRCTWEGCRFASTARRRVVSHVGSIHFGVPKQEQCQMESAEADFGFYVRKVNPIKTEN